jgi:hypothetical protein
MGGITPAASKVIQGTLPLASMWQWLLLARGFVKILPAEPSAEDAVVFGWIHPYPCLSLRMHLPVWGTAVVSKDPVVATLPPVAVILLVTALLAGCGTGLMALDPLVEDAGADAFLDRVAKQCTGKTIGRASLGTLIDDSQDVDQGAYFVDLTTKLYFGKVTREDYKNSINAFFPTGDNQAGLECIFANLGSGGGSQ